MDPIRTRMHHQLHQPAPSHYSLYGVHPLPQPPAALAYFQPSPPTSNQASPTRPTRHGAAGKQRRTATRQANAAPPATMATEDIEYEAMTSAMQQHRRMHPAPVPRPLFAPSSAATGLAVYASALPSPPVPSPRMQQPAFHWPTHQQPQPQPQQQQPPRVVLHPGFPTAAYREEKPEEEVFALRSGRHPLAGPSLPLAYAVPSAVKASHTLPAPMVDLQQQQYMQRLYQQQLQLLQQQQLAQQEYARHQHQLHQQLRPAPRQQAHQAQRPITSPSHSSPSPTSSGSEFDYPLTLAPPPPARAVGQQEKRSTLPGPTRVDMSASNGISTAAARPRSTPSADSQQQHRPLASFTHAQRLRDAAQYATSAASWNASPPPTTSTHPSTSRPSPLSGDFSNADAVYTFTRPAPAAQPRLVVSAPLDGGLLSDPLPPARSPQEGADSSSDSDREDEDDEEDARGYYQPRLSPSAAQSSPRADDWIDGLAASFTATRGAPATNSTRHHQQQQPRSRTPIDAVRTLSRPGSSTGGQPLSRGVRPISSGSSNGGGGSGGNSRRGSDQGARVSTAVAQSSSSSTYDAINGARQQRPRSTHGPRSSSTSSATTTAVSAAASSSRVGSAGVSRLQSRPRSSNSLVSPRTNVLPPDPAREAAEIFGATGELPAAYDPSSSPPPPTTTNTTRRRIRPPPVTLVLLGGTGDASFFARLPHELCFHLLHFLDTTALLTVVARLSVAWRTIVADQEAWRHVTLTGALSASSDSRTPPEPTRVAFLSEKLISLASRWTLLESLDLSGAGAVLRDDFFERIEHHPIPYWSLGLKELSLARCTLLTDTALQILAPACAVLTSLDLSWCGQITDGGLEAIVQSCGATLRVCTLNRCHGLTDSSVGALSVHCSALVELDLTFCTNLTDHAMELLARRESRCFYPHAQAAAVETNVRLPPAIREYAGLQKLSLRWCRQLTDSGVRFLMGGGGVTHVEPESIAPQPNEDGGYDLPPMFAATPVPSHSSGPMYRDNALRQLTLDHCSLLTDKSMMYISKAGLQLRELSAVFCAQLTPVAFQYLVAGSTRHLRRLILDHCEHFAGYLTLKNSATLRLLLASTVFGHLHTLSWKTCPHAGMERSRHREIEAECATITTSTNGTKTSSAVHGRVGSAQTQRIGSAASSTSSGNVLDWLHTSVNSKPNPVRVR